MNANQQIIINVLKSIPFIQVKWRMQLLSFITNQLYCSAPVSLAVFDVHCYLMFSVSICIFIICSFCQLRPFELCLVVARARALVCAFLSMCVCTKRFKLQIKWWSWIGEHYAPPWCAVQPLNLNIHIIHITGPAMSTIFQLNLNRAAPIIILLLLLFSCCCWLLTCFGSIWSCAANDEHISSK